MKRPSLLSFALLVVSCGQTNPTSQAGSAPQLHSLTDSNTPGTGPSWTGGSFTDDFAFWGFNDALWERSGNNNGSPFGCAFSPDNAVPDAWAQSSGKLNLKLNTAGTRCAEMRTRAQQAAPRATIGGGFNTDKVAGTVASIFTFKRWDTGGGSWQEIDIEYLPTWPGAGNQPRLHAAVIYRASPTADKYMAAS